MLELVENGSGYICHVIHQYAKTNNKYTKNIMKTKSHRI